jgi:hypothetical protein
LQIIDFSPHSKEIASILQFLLKVADKLARSPKCNFFPTEKILFLGRPGVNVINTFGDFHQFCGKKVPA